jgi:hypothetical protein
MKMTTTTIIITTNGRIGMKMMTTMKTITGLLPDIRMRKRMTKTISMNVTTRMMTIRTAGECMEDMKTKKMSKEAVTIVEVKEIIIGGPQTVIIMKSQEITDQEIMAAVPAHPVLIPETVVSVATVKVIL